MGTKRRRLPAARARAAILDAAERQLSERGPDGIRLTNLAAELGISHPAILHHFGSRAGLVRAVVARTVETLEQEVIARLSAGVDEDVATDVMERVFELLTERRHARTLAWLYLTHGEDAGDPIGYAAQLRRIADAVHAIRRQRLGDGCPPYDDTLFTVALASVALFGQAITGSAMRRRAGVDQRAFLRWLTRLLMDHLDRQPADRG